MQICSTRWEKVACKTIVRHRMEGDFWKLKAAGRRISCCTTTAALAAYEAERRPATTDLVLLNRRNGPEQVMQLVEERAPKGFNVVTDVLSRQELEDIAANYKRVAGFQVEALNAKPPIVAVPGRVETSGQSGGVSSSHM